MVTERNWISFTTFCSRWLFPTEVLHYCPTEKPQPIQSKRLSPELELGLLLVCFTHPKRKRKTLKVLSQPDYVHSIQLCHWPSEVTGQSIVACCRVIRGDSGVACAVLTNAGRREKTTPHRRTGCQLFMLQQHGGRLEPMLGLHAPAFVPSMFHRLVWVWETLKSWHISIIFQ